MPTIEFKGKQFVHSHHLSVPFRELVIEKEKSLPPEGGKPSLDDNLIIHGDNLEALKALLPTHAGKVDCIFIDPPYNTGNEGWCYNDNVRSPLMKEWLKKSANPVDKEDLERHDKWLCMMWPRLHLLHELLSENGSFWMTLDDNEIHRARALLDEIFGEHNFVATIAWQKIFSTKNTASQFSESFDHIIIYAKHSCDWFPNLLKRGKEQTERYTNPDNDPRGPWTSGDCAARNPYSEGLYEIETPSGRIIEGPPKGTYWRFSKSKFDQLNEDNRIWWGKDGNNVPRVKRFRSEVKEGLVPDTLWTHEVAGHTQEAKRELIQILSFESNDDVFITPKPVKLIERVLELATQPDSLILDSFAGSGTTAHAVLSANKKDGGNRRFILVECEDYADSLTAERVRRVINGYSFQGTQREELYSEKITWSNFSKSSQKILEKVESIEQLEGAGYDNVSKQINDGVLKIIGERKVEEQTPGIGGSFTFCELGAPIQIESLLSGRDMPGFEPLARYVFYTATGQSLENIAASSPSGYIGQTDLFRVHLLYKPDREWLRSNEAALNMEQMKLIARENTSGKRAIVFAVAKFMSQRELTKQRIEFCQLPYAIHRILGD